MKGIFVNTIVEMNQGYTDFGYYVDGDGNPSSGEDIEEMVENDEAYTVEIFPSYDGVHVRMKSANRKALAEFEGEVGIKHRGLRSTPYHRTGDPVFPSHFEEHEERNRALTEIAEYTLNHGRGQGLEVEDVEWDDLMDDENFSEM